MPQLIAFAIIGTGLYAGYRWASRKVEDLRAEAERRAAADQRRQASDATGRPRDLGTLELDTKSGVYKPKRD
jgi:hypothetical protein